MLLGEHGAGEADQELVEPDERGDPMSPLRWTLKSLRTLAGELTRPGVQEAVAPRRRSCPSGGLPLPARYQQVEQDRAPSPRPAPAWARDRDQDRAQAEQRSF